MNDKFVVKTAMEIEDKIYERGISRSCLDERPQDMGCYMSYLAGDELNALLEEIKDDCTKDVWKDLILLWNWWNNLSHNYGILARRAKRIVGVDVDL